MISELFQFFLDHPDRLPENYAESLEPPHRIICDYIAGMTDGYFRRIHGAYCGERNRSVFR
jgi:dGTPase